MAAPRSPGLAGDMAFAPNSIDIPMGSPRSAMGDFTIPRSPTFPDQQSPRLNDGPLPLPSFVFPARASPASAPASFSRATGRRPVSAIELGTKSAENIRTTEDTSTHTTPELPPFTFGSSSTSPPPSPRAIPGRSGAHKRGTSEFIGGDGMTGKGMGLMSTSPTKGDGVLPPPTGFGPPGGRRGHRHVRSAAISHHDLTMILKPPTSPTSNAPRGSSAPCSPSGDHEVQQSRSTFPSSLDSALHSGNEVGVTNSPVESTSLPNVPTRALNRARVGFSDNVEVIPRPLSLVSSDSSSTVTMRQGHSVSNSISSIISAGTSSPPSKEKRGLPSPTRIMDTRPRTAEPILSHPTSQMPDPPKRRNSIPLLMEAAVAGSSSAPSTPRSAKKWGFFSHESGESSPRSRPTSSGSGPKESKPVPSKFPALDGEMPSADTPLRSTESPNRRRSSSLSRKSSSKKQKKVRNWAGSILSRKTRQRSQKQKLSRRSPTPPHRSYGPMNDRSAPPSFELSQPELSLVTPERDIASWKPRKLPPQDDDLMSPMIDLDAALGPFNTPSSFGDDWDSSQRIGGSKKRAMHSAAGLGGFAGPGMHYHRRAESAPEFENPRFGLHRLGSSSTMGMEDVFEEDEEDEWEDTKTSSDKEDSNMMGKDMNNALGIDIQVEDTEDKGYDTEMESQESGSINSRGVKRKGSSLSEGDRRTVGTAKSEHSATSLMDEPIQEEAASPVEILDDSSSSRPDSRARSSDSTASPPFRPRPGKELAPVDIQPLALQPPLITPTSPRSTTQSSFPSPRSPFSYDAQRISTAPSSVADEHAFQSLLLGEPGPEVRYSVDIDVPSLTSSNSTMTRDSGHPALQNSQFRDGQRSASLSSAAVTRKRSSMASLSRLISSAHGEKSKLSIESHAPGPAETKKEKGSKSKRISRMMQFWKPKESSS